MLCHVLCILHNAFGEINDDEDDITKLHNESLVIEQLTPALVTIVNESCRHFHDNQQNQK